MNHDIMEHSNTTIYPAKVDDLLFEANYQKIIDLLPIILTMSVFGIVGIVGNIITIKFYSSKQRRTPTIFLIISLSVVDLIVCFLFAPNIVEMCLNVLYTNAIACKAMHFLGHWFVESSGLIIGFIAFDRYWKICGNTRRRITSTVAKRAVVIILVFSCVMSGRDFVNFDIVNVHFKTSENSTTLLGHYCTNSNDPRLKLSVLIFHVVDAFTFLLILIVIVFTYSNVVRTLCKLEEIRRSIAPRSPDLTIDEMKTTEEQQSNQQANDSAERVSQSSVTNQIEEDLDTCLSIQENMSTIQRKKKRAKKRNKKIRKSERNVTILMLAVSVAFFLCAAPYFVVKIGIRSLKRSSDLELDLPIQFCLRLGYINSVLNPLIYCIFNPAFRRHMKRILLCRSKESVDSIFSMGTSNWTSAVSRA